LRRLVLQVSAQEAPAQRAPHGAHLIELELMQSHMAQKPMLRGEVGNLPSGDGFQIGDRVEAKVKNPFKVGSIAKAGSARCSSAAPSKATGRTISLASTSTCDPAMRLSIWPKSTPRPGRRTKAQGLHAGRVARLSVNPHHGAPAAREGAGAVEQARHH